MTTTTISVKDTSPMNFEKEYQEACNRQTDMCEHLPWISEIVSKFKHATEFGVGYAQSTRGFLRHDIEMHSYEIQVYPETDEYFKDAIAAGRNVTLHVESTLEADVAPTDVLLVDSYHSYDQVVQELALHAHKVKKYIFLHDTTLFGELGQGMEKGIWPAIQEFLDSHPEWQLVERRTNCNGMTLIERV
jgi:cephalosporin hydroxylase